VKDGSGYFELDTKGSNKINVTYNQTTKSIEIKPLIQGKSTIILRDLCVPSKRETVIEVDVTGIGKIDVLAEDKIPVDGHKLLTVSLHDYNGRLLPPEILPLVKLSLRPMPFDILEVTPVISENDVNKKHSTSTARFQYKIVGKRVGVAEIVFSAENGNIISETKRIDVFPPLKLSPKIFTILPGNLVTVTANGGPNDADIVFSSSPGTENIINNISLLWYWSI
jgi:nuclear pore complex protein Nup210